MPADFPKRPIPPSATALGKVPHFASPADESADDAPARAMAAAFSGRLGPALPRRHVKPEEGSGPFKPGKGIARGGGRPDRPAPAGKAGHGPRKGHR